MKKTFTLALSLWFGSLFSQVQTYTVPGTYSFTVPAGVSTLTLEVVGAGGSGGGNGGGGGGGGGYAKGVYTVAPGAVLSVNVGTGGGGPSGGTSNVGSLISASGGVNGTWVSNPTIGGGGAGGAGTGGTIANYTGGTGGGGYWTYFGGGGAGSAGSASNGTNGGNTIAWTGVCQTPGGSAGTGGGAPGGGGGKGAGFTDSGCNVTNPSAGGANFGGGGGGGNGNGGGPGTGAGGYCQINWSGGCTPPVAPTNATSASNQTICAIQTTTLMATGTGTLNWYSSPTSTMSLATGTAYTTPTLSAGSYTYYAAATNTCSEGPRTAITVSVNPLPVITANTGTVCSQNSFTFVPTGASTYTYVAGGTNVKTPVIPSSVPSATVTYVINGTSAEGCIGTGSLSVVVYSRPTLTISSNPSVICVGQSATLTATGADTYQWTSFFGTYTTAVVVVSPTTTATYIASGRRTSTGCSDLTSLSLTVNACTGIETLAANEAVLSIYPNPGKGDVTIAADRDMTISVVNNLGQVVKTISINAGNNYKADISNLANGIYGIIDESNQRVIKQKIVVAK